MAIRKTTQKYNFSVEGETEKWYFDWLQEKINKEPTAKYKVSVDSKIQNPIKRAKSINVLTKTEIIHAIVMPPINFSNYPS